MVEWRSGPSRKGDFQIAPKRRFVNRRSLARKLTALCLISMSRCTRPAGFLGSLDREIFAAVIGVSALVLVLQIVMGQRQTVALERSEPRVDPRQHLARNAAYGLV